MAFYDDEELMLPLSSKKKKKAKDLSRMIPLKILKMSKAYIACDEYDDPSATTSSDYSTDDDRTNAFINARRHFMRMIDRAVLNLTEDDDPDDHDSHKTEEGTNFKGFYNNVANGKYRNPWIRESMPTKRLEKRLTFLIRMQLLKVGHQEYGIDFGEPVEQHLKAEESLTRFENELVDSLCKIGGFGRDVLNRTKENPVKTPLTKIQALHVFDGAIGHICQSEHCEFSYDTPNRFYRECFYQLEQAEPISEGIFRESKNAPIKLDRNATPLVFCPVHGYFYEILHAIVHMKFNIYMNCKAKVAEIFSEFNEREKQHVIDNPNDFKAIIPYEFFESLISFCEQRYWILWAFGDHVEWKAKGSTINVFGRPGNGRVANKTS